LGRAGCWWSSRGPWDCLLADGSLMFGWFDWLPPHAIGFIIMSGLVIAVWAISNLMGF